MLNLLKLKQDVDNVLGNVHKQVVVVLHHVERQQAGVVVVVSNFSDIRRPEKGAFSFFIYELDLNNSFS
jgi:chemotaxis regulatin CheY-phosphate phosphatase CheZ